MMADDIATSPANPHPNQIFNRPGGPDVYDGVPIVSQLIPQMQPAVLEADMSVDNRMYLLTGILSTPCK